MASRGLFPGAPSKTGELSKTNSRSVEQALSYFTVESWFSAMIFHYRSAEFFSTAYAIDSCHRLINKLLGI